MDRSNSELARRIAELAAAKGGRCYFVGGCVRDELLGRDSKDIDIEVHGLAPAVLEAILDSVGQRISIGESFGIYSLKGTQLDIAMPRKEQLRGRGHRDFDVFVDPFIGTEAACRRRDFTCNALMKDILSDELIDPFGGAEDLRQGILRHVNSESFTEDELRVLRAAQFAARFGFKIAEETVTLCRGMELKHLAGERVMGELEKALLQAERPSVFFEELRNMHALGTWFPELEALIGIAQPPRYHGEGDVWTHTMMVLNQAAKLRLRTEKPLYFMLSALCHDFGKAVCSEEKDGVMHAYAHETKGLPLVERFLSRITRERKLTEYVLNMTELHMKPVTAAFRGSSVKVTNRMFDSSLEPMALILLALSDDRGRISLAPSDVDAEAFLLERLEIYREYMARPYVMGRDLVEAGVRPGKSFTEMLAFAHKLRLAGVDKQSALKQTLAYGRKLDRTE